MAFKEGFGGSGGLARQVQGLKVPEVLGGLARSKKVLEVSGWYGAGQVKGSSKVPAAPVCPARPRWLPN